MVIVTANTEERSRSIQKLQNLTLYISHFAPHTTHFTLHIVHFTFYFSPESKAGDRTWKRPFPYLSIASHPWLVCSPRYTYSGIPHEYSYTSHSDKGLGSSHINLWNDNLKWNEFNQRIIRSSNAYTNFLHLDLFLVDKCFCAQREWALKETVVLRRCVVYEIIWFHQLSW